MSRQAITTRAAGRCKWCGWPTASETGYCCAACRQIDDEAEEWAENNTLTRDMDARSVSPDNKKGGSDE